MEGMIQFNIALLGAVADFLKTEPIFYLFGVVIFLFVVKSFLLILSFARPR